MADYNRGVKAGGYAGFIFGVINAILVTIILLVLWESFSTTSMPDFASSIFISIIITSFISTIFSGIIGGAIFGVIYAAIYNKLPGSTSAMKGIVLALVYWLVFSIIIGYYRRSDYDIMYYYVVNIGLGLVLYLFWGVLIGKFWDKYADGEKKPLV